MDPFTAGVGGAGAIVAAAGAIVQVVNFAVGTSGSVEPAYGPSASTLDDEHLERLRIRSGGQLTVIALTRHRIPFRFYRKSVVKAHVDRVTFVPKTLRLVSHGTEEKQATRQFETLLERMKHSETRVQIPLMVECDVIGFGYRQGGTDKVEYHIRSATIKPWHGADILSSNYFQEKASLGFTARGRLVVDAAAAVNAKSSVIFSWHFHSEGRRFRATGGEKQGDLSLTLESTGQPTLTAFPDKHNIEILADRGSSQALAVGSTVPLKAKKADAGKDDKDGAKAAAGAAVRDRTSGMVAPKVERYAADAGDDGVWWPEQGKVKEALRRYLKDRYAMPQSYAPAQLRLDAAFERFTPDEWSIFLAYQSGALFDAGSELRQRISTSDAYRSDEAAADLAGRAGKELDQLFKSFAADRLKPVPAADRAERAQWLFDSYLEYVSELLDNTRFGAVDDSLRGKIVHAAKSGIVEVARVFGVDPELAQEQTEALFAETVDSGTDNVDKVAAAIGQLASAAADRRLSLDSLADLRAWIERGGRS